MTTSIYKGDTCKLQPSDSVKALEHLETSQATSGRTPPRPPRPFLKVALAIISTLVFFLSFRFWLDLVFQCVAWLLAICRHSWNLPHHFWLVGHFWQFGVHAFTPLAFSDSLRRACSALLGFLQYPAVLLSWHLSRKLRTEQNLFQVARPAFSSDSGWPSRFQRVAWLLAACWRSRISNHFAPHSGAL